MDDIVTLILLSLAMLVGCYLAGSIPLAFTFSEEKLKMITVMGAGLLVGTALAVIIPEGVHTLYETAAEAHAHVADAVESKDAGAGAGADHEHHHDHHHEHEHETEMHTFIGVSLVLGFVFMLLVDQLSGGGHSHSGGGGHAKDLDENATRIGGKLDEKPARKRKQLNGESGPSVSHTRKNMTATIGLVVHAAADGIALGAAATTSQTHVEMIVFVAIMLHKAPAAFGLVSFLLHEGFDRNRIRRHLGVFSAAAPLLAIITYFGLSQQSKETLSKVNATGIAMLFSAGTFLYVATVHVLPELASMGTTKTTLSDGSVMIREQKGFTKLELFLMVTGAMLPVFLSLGHHH